MTAGSTGAARLMEVLGLTEDELCAALGADPLTLLSGELEHRPELPILLTMLNEALEAADPSMLQRWVRASGPQGRPIDLLTARDFAGFEDALGQFAQRGFVIRGGGQQPGQGPGGHQSGQGLGGHQPGGGTPDG